MHISFHIFPAITQAYVYLNIWDDNPLSDGFDVHHAVGDVFILALHQEDVNM